MQKIEYHGWPNCYLLNNGSVELIVTTDIGPRIISFAAAGGENIFQEFPATLGLTGSDKWRSYGGHRLWHAPEEANRTYYPDNHQVGIEINKGAVTLVQNIEPKTGIQKEIEIKLVKGAPGVKVIHRLRNCNLWDIKISAWAVSVFPEEAIGIIPLPPRKPREEALSPSSSIVLWPYTNLADPRWIWTLKFFGIRQNTSFGHLQRAGISGPCAWAACCRHKQLFVKRFPHFDDQEYPHRGCSAELSADGDALELASLGPVKTAPPGGFIEHEEEWLIFRDLPELKNESDILREVFPRAESASLEKP